MGLLLAWQVACRPPPLVPVAPAHRHQDGVVGVGIPALEDVSEHVRVPPLEPPLIILILTLLRRGVAPDHGHSLVRTVRAEFRLLHVLSALV